MTGAISSPRRAAPDQRTHRTPGVSRSFSGATPGTICSPTIRPRDRAAAAGGHDGAAFCLWAWQAASNCLLQSETPGTDGLPGARQSQSRYFSFAKSELRERFTRSAGRSARWCCNLCARPEPMKQQLSWFGETAERHKPPRRRAGAVTGPPGHRSRWVQPVEHLRSRIFSFASLSLAFLRPHRLSSLAMPPAFPS